MKSNVSPLARDLYIDVQVDTMFEFCTHARRGLNDWVTKLLLIILTFLESVLVAVIIHTYKKR